MTRPHSAETHQTAESAAERERRKALRARDERQHACEEAILALANGTPPEWARTFAEQASPTVSPRMNEGKKGKKSKMAKQQRSLRRSMHPKENRDRGGKQDGSGSNVLADALRAALKPDNEIAEEIEQHRPLPGKRAPDIEEHQKRARLACSKEK